MATFHDKQIQSHLTRREFSEAQQMIQQKLEAEPTSADAYYLKGVLHYFQGQISDTIENLKRSLALDPRHTDAAICLSVLLNDIGKYDDAKRIFEGANQSVIHKNASGDLGIDKKFAVKHLELADLYFRYRRYDEAIEEYSKAAILDPTHAEIKIRRAKAFAKKGFVSRAIQELELIRNQQPSYAPARIQLGLLHYSQGNGLDAELEWEAVLKDHPDHQEAKTYLQMSMRDRN